MKVKGKLSNWVCPYCGSKHINNISFDFINYCLDCGKDWEAT